MSDATPQVRQLPRLNEMAPEFEANSTQGAIKLSNYKGKWVVLFSHPADFTPVCTTEFVEFARHQADFEAKNCQLVGLSVDGLFAHISWVRQIEKMFGVEIKFPVIADLDMKVAQSYGMIHPGASDTATVRCVFVIDDKGKVRTMIYYPLSNGRSIQEVLRILTALQTSDKHAVATPCEWKDGEEVIIPPPRTQADAAARLKDPNVTEQKDWWFSKKKL